LALPIGQTLGLLYRKDLHGERPQNLACDRWRRPDANDDATGPRDAP